MTEPQKKYNVIPGIAIAGLLLGVAALIAAIIAVIRVGDSPSDPMTGMSGMSSMSAEAMHHMEPVPIDGIKDAPSDAGGTPLKGTMRDGVMEFTLDARPVWWRIQGKQRLAAYAYNGIVPGPEIHVANGQKVRINFTNNLPVPTTVHWHGIGVPAAMDGVPGVTQKEIPPGGTFTYAFTARPAGNPSGGGTFLYHSHVDEDVQMGVGLSGAFIIDPATPAPRYAVEKTLVFSEWTADAATGRTRGVMEMEGMLPNFFTFNGKSFPDTGEIKVPAGKPVLLRLVNAGQFAHPIHLHGTAFTVIAKDGHPVPAAAQEQRDTITLSSGERADVVFTEPAGKWLLHCHIGHHLTNDGAMPGGLVTMVTAR